MYTRSKGKEEEAEFEPDSIHLFIGYKGDKKSALKYYKERNKSGEIRSIFGSYYYTYPVHKTTKKVYSIS